MVEGSQINSTAGVCQTCGDSGFAELLLCCSKCQISAEHRYCLAKIPKADEEFTYACAQCVLSSAKQLSSKQPLPSVPDLRTSVRTDKRHVHNVKKRQANSSSSATVVEDEVQTSDISSFLPTSASEPFVNNVVLETDLNQNCRSPLRVDQPATLVIDLKKQANNSSAAENEAAVHTLERPPSLKTFVSDSLAKDVQTEDYLNENKNSAYSNDANSGDQVIKRKRRRLIHEDWEKSDEETECIEVQESQTSDIPPLQISATDPSIKDLKPEANLNENKRSPHSFDVQEVKRNRRRLLHDDWDKSDEGIECAEGQQLQVAPVAQVDPVKSRDKVEVQSPRPVIGSPSYVYAQPIIDPAWRGYFVIGKENFGRLVGHLSNKACFKVFEATKMMPPVLSVSIMPRLDAWPKSFNVSSPTDENIALYFFPGIESVVKAFDDRMLHIIKHDLAMKVLLGNAELLIFPSNQLPLLYRRFNGKHYLWGVFRERQGSLSPESGNSHIKQISAVCSMSLAAHRVNKKSDSFESLRLSPLSPLCRSGSYSSD